VKTLEKLVVLQQFTQVLATQTLTPYYTRRASLLLDVLEGSPSQNHTVLKDHMKSM
jgi:hypothetical protein